MRLLIYCLCWDSSLLTSSDIKSMCHSNLFVGFKIKYLFIEILKCKIFFYVLENNKVDNKGQVCRNENKTKSLSAKEIISEDGEEIWTTNKE